MPEEKSNIIWIVIIGTIVFLLVVTFIVSFLFFYTRRHNRFITDAKERELKFKEELMQSRIETQEETFQQIAKELHDHVGQLLSSTKMLVGVAQQDAQHSKKALDKADETLADSIAALRSLSKSLDKEWLDRFNLVENLQTEANRINAANELTIVLSHPQRLTIQPGTQIILFRMIQEALQNAIKHAEAETMTITITEDPVSLQIIVTDDGKGFEVGQSVNHGMGRNNIEHRAHLLGGIATWVSSPGLGTTLSISLPLQKGLV